MVYRKGEKSVERRVVNYSADHPVARGIADGDHWMDAWLGQMCTPWETITRKTEIPRERIEELTDDAAPAPEEIEKLAALWWVTPDGLRKSIEQANGIR